MVIAGNDCWTTKVHADGLTPSRYFIILHFLRLHRLSLVFPTIVRLGFPQSFVSHIVGSQHAPQHINGARWKAIIISARSPWYAICSASRPAAARSSSGQTGNRRFPRFQNGGALYSSCNVYTNMKYENPEVIDSVTIDK
jgi:hypothetical protein